MIYFEYHERVKPYVRMTQRGKFVKPEALEYLASKDALAFAMKNSLQLRQEQAFKKEAFALNFTYYAPDLYTYDLDNLIKAVLDAGNKIFWQDDRYCVRVRAFKERGPYCLDLEVLGVL